VKLTILTENGTIFGVSDHLNPDAGMAVQLNSRGVYQEDFRQGSEVRCWHIASIRGNAALQSLSGRSGH